MPSVLLKARSIFSKRDAGGAAAVSLPAGESTSTPASASSSSSRRPSADDVDEAEPDAADASAPASRRGSVVAGLTSTDAAAAERGTLKGKTRAIRLERIPSNGAKIEFYRMDQPFFWLSNSSDYPVFLDGVRYPTAEHLFQACKFLGHRPDLATKVRKAASPSEAIKEARRHAAYVRKGWIRNGLNVQTMKEVLLLKFTQHTDLRRALLQTGDAEIESASPTDAFWGSANAPRSGAQSLGRNELGKALVKTRELLRSASGLGIGSGAVTV